MLHFKNFTEAYYTLIHHVYQRPMFTCKPRGQLVKENLISTFAIMDPRNRLLDVPQREFPLTYVVAESLWYLLGENKTEWIANYSGFWKNISDDGQTANSAYGARIFKTNPKIAQGRLTQWEYIKEELKRDPDSRRAVILIRVPDDSVDAKLDVPCTLSLQFFIREGKLDLVVTMRSSDLILGITNDVPAFCLFQEMMALELGVELGTYYHVSNSLHIYEKHFPMCERILATEPKLTEQWAVKPLPAITSAPPLQALDRIQEMARSVTTPAGLRHLYETAFDKLMQGCTDPYWCDWAKLLMAHRAGKLGDEAFKQELIKATSFEGYHRYSK